MLGYALRGVKLRSALWPPALGLALVAALPGALLATVLAPAATAFLLSADVRVAAALLPAPLDSAHPAAWLAAVAAAAVLGTAWVRLYLLLLWCSDQRKEARLAAAWRGTRAAWPRSLAMYAEAQSLTIATFVVLLALVALAAPPKVAMLTTLAALLAAVAVRSVIRVALTLALRAVALDGQAHGVAWARARGILRERRRDAVAAWIALAALGVAVWIGGRLVTPALQDSALAYGHQSAATYVREVAHMAFAVPLEAFLLTLSAGVWTALYLGGDALKEPRNVGGVNDTWTLRALAALVLLVLVGNAAPTLVDRTEVRAETRRRAELAEDEIRPEAALRPAAAPTGTPDYDVDALLEGTRLRWETTIRWDNDTGATVDDLGVQVFANAFTRELEDLPLAAEVLQTPAAHRSARPGELDVVEVRIDGEPASSFELEDTALTIPLPTAAPPGARVVARVTLDATLPRFPERFGLWREMTLLGNWIPVVAPWEGGGWRFAHYGSVGDPFVSDVSRYDVALSLPASQEALGTGTLTGIEEDGDRRVWRFEAEEARDAAFAVSPFWRGRESLVGGTIVRAWFPADRSIDGAALLEASASAVADFTRRYGSLPFDEVEVVQTNGFLGGMEYPGIVFVADPRSALQGFPLLPELLAHAAFDDAARRYVVGHEVAHQWWYASVGSDQVREPWLDEALAEASTRIWLRETQGDDRAWLMTNLSPAPEPDPGIVSAETRDYTNNVRYTREVYLEGSEVLLRVRERVGAAAFDLVLRRWHERGRGRIAAIDEFVALVAEVAGAEAEAILERYR